MKCSPGSLRLSQAVELSSRVLASSYEYSKYTAELELAFNPFAQHGLELHAFAGLIQGRAPFFSQFFVRDFSHFSLGTQALPRILGLNFSSFNDYDDLVFDLGAQYAVPIASGTQGVYRAYLYAAVDLAVTASLDELQQDSTGRGLGARARAKRQAKQAQPGAFEEGDAKAVLMLLGAGGKAGEAEHDVGRRVAVHAEQLAHGMLLQPRSNNSRHHAPGLVRLLGMWVSSSTPLMRRRRLGLRRALHTSRSTSHG